MMVTQKSLLSCLALTEFDDIDISLNLNTLGKISADNILKYFSYFFPENSLTFLANCLLR